jgi:predicted Zn finger-like uncharacterized protein
MIIECKSCSRKFIVRDIDIPTEGRNVQCGFCSVFWHQMPVSVDTKPLKTKEINQIQKKAKKNISVNIVKASNGKTYKFLGSQWAEVLSSGKTGIFATKKIGKELNKTTGRKIEKKPRMKINPSSLAANNSKQLPEVYKSQKGLGFLGYVILIIIISASLIGVIKTFENVWLSYFPQDQYIFELLNMQLDYVAETFKNIFTIAKDLYNSY